MMNSLFPAFANLAGVGDAASLEAGVEAPGKSGETAKSEGDAFAMALLSAIGSEGASPEEMKGLLRHAESGLSGEAPEESETQGEEGKTSTDTSSEQSSTGKGSARNPSSGLGAQVRSEASPSSGEARNPATSGSVDSPPRPGPASRPNPAIRNNAAQNIPTVARGQEGRAMQRTSESPRSGEGQGVGPDVTGPGLGTPAGTPAGTPVRNPVGSPADDQVTRFLPTSASPMASQGQAQDAVNKALDGAVREFTPPKVEAPPKVQRPIPPRMAAKAVSKTASRAVSAPTKGVNPGSEAILTPSSTRSSLSEAATTAAGRLDDGPAARADAGPETAAKPEALPAESKATAAPTPPTAVKEPEAPVSEEKAESTAESVSSSSARGATTEAPEAGLSPTRPSGELATAPAMEATSDLAASIPGVSRTATASTRSVLSTDRDMSKLVPGFQQKVENVIGRMEAEYGHRVEMVEGYRSPARQGFLYSQGRSRSGPVVTWTKDSLHTEGRAADFQVDGSWKNPLGYSRLQKIAQEEGLTTLGARDPGHLELPGEGTSSARAGRTSPFGPSPEARVAQAPLAARVARTARVAAASSPPSVARVARVARPATPGRIRSQTPVMQGPSGEGTAEQAGGSPPASPERAGGPSTFAQRIPAPVREAQVPAVDGESEAIRADTRRAKIDTGTLHTAEAPTRDPLVAAAEISPIRTTASLGSTFPSVSAPAGAEAVDRVLSVKEAVEAFPVRNVHLDLENADGEGTRLRLDLRGSTLGATIDLEDPASAEMMRTRINELHRALSRAGLDPESLRIQTSRLPMEGTEALRNTRIGTVEAIRPQTLDVENTSRSESSGGRSQGDTAHGRQDGSRYRNPSQQNRTREEER